MPALTRKGKQDIEMQALFSKSHQKKRFSHDLFFYTSFVTTLLAVGQYNPKPTNKYACIYIYIHKKR